MVTSRNCLVNVVVAFVSFNVTVFIVMFVYTPNVAPLLHSANTPHTTPSHQAHLADPDDHPRRPPADLDKHSDTNQPHSLHLASQLADRHNFRLPNRLITEYDAVIAERVTSLAARRAPARDAQLVQLVRDVIDPPPANKAGYKMFKVDKTPQVSEVDQLLNSMTDGFFIECGGLDGERLSNSAFLERERNWQGLLVEMDPFFYTQLLGKNRRVWSINSCLSPFNYFTTLKYAGDSRGRGQLLVDPADRRVRSMHVDRQKVVPCFPLETILEALNRTTVNYFSLDVEGFELPILKSIDWSRVDIQVLSVEFNRGKDKLAYSQYMESVGYVTVKEIHSGSFFAHDFLFVSRKLYDSLDDNQQQRQANRHQHEQRRQAHINVDNDNNNYDMF